MAAAIRAHDWAATPLGPVAVWSQSLRAAVELCLASGFASFVWWGPQLIQIYNDAALAVVRAKHPAAFAVPACQAWAEVWSETEALVEHVLRTGDPVVEENRLSSPDRGGGREPAYFTFCCSALRDEQGSVGGVFITAIETTEKMRAEAARLECEHRLHGAAEVAGLSTDFRVLFEAVPTPLLVLTPPDFRIVAVNDAYLQATMTQRDAILGRRMFDIFPDDPQDPQATGVSNLRDSLARVLSARRPDLMPLQRYPLRLPIEKGGGFEERWWSYLNSPVLGANGEVAFVLHRSEDVTEVVRLRSASEVLDQLVRDQIALIARLRAVNEEAARSEQALRESEASLRAAFEQAAIGIAQGDAKGRMLRVNRKFCEMLGYEEGELLGMSIRDITAEEDQAETASHFQQLLAGKIGSYTIEKRYRRKDGSLIWCRVTGCAIRDPRTGQFWYGLALIEDITEQRQAEQRAREAMQHDPLTRLPNRRLVFEYAEHLLAAAARQHSQGAFLFVDLDRFKPVNDLYGHEVGDRVLEEVARRLNASVRQEDLVGRFGGDEFVIMLPHLEAPHHAAAVAHHVIDEISAPVHVRELSISITTSVGISLFPQHGLEAEALIHAADLAMYHAKQVGAGGYAIYTPELAQQAQQMSILESRLKRAIRNRGLVLHYQPVVDMKSGRPTGAEALLRIFDEEGLPISPGRFIPVAEAAGLIGQLGEWVAAEACRQHRAWLAEGLPPIQVSINVSPLQFRQPDFAQRLCEIVRLSGIDPAYFQIEVTESAVMDSVAEGVEKLKLLKSAGIKVALDDFGTGYSSLSYLSQLPIDRLKVDQSFVKRIEHDRIGRAITDAVIALGRTLDLEVVGEGVESDKARSYLRRHGCHKGQGYFFSRPLSQDEFVGWYRSH